MRLERWVAGCFFFTRRFQFHKGAIRTVRIAAAEFRLRHFNSIKVRLELLLVVYMVTVFLDFNSIKVRLEPHRIFLCALSSSYFNSIKVRLERMPITCSLKALLFQFHKGAIRTIDPKLSKQVFDNFNSIKVRLELWYCCK